MQVSPKVQNTSSKYDSEMHKVHLSLSATAIEATENI